jgi:hypothetical protein
MRREENPDGTERQKEVSFRILEIKRNHHDGKNLIVIAMKVDDDDYELSFLMDSFSATFFPEFKEIDRYAGMGGYKYIFNFLMSVNSKIKYFSEVHMKNKTKDDFQTDEEEWWMDLHKLNSEEKFNNWVKKNKDYLSQQDLSGFDNDMIEEVVGYFNKRKEFIKPTFEEETVSLNELLERAIDKEDYEEAAKIREKIKTIK